MKKENTFMEEYTNREIGLILSQVKESISSINIKLDDSLLRLESQINENTNWRRANANMLETIEKERNDTRKRIIDLSWKIINGLVLATVAILFGIDKL